MSNIDLMQKFRGHVFAPGKEFKGINSRAIPSEYSVEMVRDLITKGYDLNNLNTGCSESEQSANVYGCECTGACN